MKSLYYFSAFDLMIAVEYDEVENQLLYSSHRRIKSEERIAVESYILRDIAPRTRYFDRIPSKLMFLGIEQNLIVELKQFHKENSTTTAEPKTDEVDQVIKNLINSSLSNYYFEMIGNEIIELRKKLKTNSNRQLINSEMKMVKLIEAYNWYSGKSLVLEDVIPKEIRDCMQEFCMEEKN